MTDYIVRNNDIVALNNHIVLENRQVVKAIEMTNHALKELLDCTTRFDINVFEVLGMRNFSGLVGEFFAKCLQRQSGGKLQSNLHQDGYPDMLLTDTDEKKSYYDSLYTIESGRKKPKDKGLFSPYKYGGIEVKACCGSTPPASKIPKPLIGEQRIDIITSFDWKAHHRMTNNLMGILWDFIGGCPTVVACFYKNDLTEKDWGKIVEPKTGGGRTTSVSIMNRSGIKKMCQNWVAVIDDDQYIRQFGIRKVR